MPIPGTLYVFLNGLTVGHQEANSLTIVLPLVTGHVYRAGSWLAETEIAPGAQLILKNANEDGEADYNAVPFMIHLKGCSLNSAGRAATIELPRPKRVLEFLLGQDPDFIAKVVNPRATLQSGQTKMKKLASVQVLVYDYPDENRLFLSGHGWEPSSTGGVTHLHIISTSERPEPHSHFLETEKSLAGLINNYPGFEFNPLPQIPSPSWSEAGSPYYAGARGGLKGYGLKALSNFSGDYILTSNGGFAFAQAELEGFPARMVRIGRLGRMIQQGRKLDGLLHEADLLWEIPDDCGPIGL